MAGEKKKKSIVKIVVIVLIVLVVIGAVGSTGGGNSSTDQPATSSTGQQVETPAAQEEPYAISDEVVDTSNPYLYTITGTLTNNTDSDKSYIQVEYNLYDAEGAQIGTALANTNNLKAGGAWKFEASSLSIDDPSQVASYELVGVTGF